MTRSKSIAAVLFAACMVTSAQAADVTAGSLKISAPWARATPHGASVGGGYVTVTNTGTTPDRLLGGSTAVASRLEVHEMSMDNGVMKMRPVVGGIEIAPGQMVKLDPSGYHIMFVGVKQPLKEGEHFKATLDFAKAGKVEVDFTVEGIAAMSIGGTHPMPGGMQMK
jgi:copper(I)-binding protein